MASDRPPKRLSLNPITFLSPARAMPADDPDMLKHFERFVGLLGAATARITSEYFHLPVAGADAIYRERVYCYELYHQLRCLWVDFPLTLGGEVDKSGAPHFRGGPKPDLLVHAPGHMGHNLVVLEVKPIIAGVHQIRTDLQKPTWFHRHADYFRGIFLSYGEDGGEGRLRESLHYATRTQDVDPAVLEIFYHRRYGEGAVHLRL